MGFFTDRALPLHHLSPPMQRVYDVGARAAVSDANILITGEPGVGKKTMAYRLHKLSARSGKPMVSIQCMALTDSLVEMELFGHEDGAVPGAGPARPGLLETASGGTVFLEEIGYLSAALQHLLNGAMERRQVCRAGGIRPRPIDVRFIATTERDLEGEAVKGTFRPDLYRRISEVSLVIPPLRDRRSEIRELACFFVAEQCWQDGRQNVPIAPAALAMLEECNWNDNILMLRLLVSRAVLLCDVPEIRPEHLFGGGRR